MGTSLFSRGTAVEPLGDGRYAARSRRDVELPDRAAGRDRRRDRGPGDDRRARRSRADRCAAINVGVRRTGAGGPGRDRRHRAAARPIDVAAAARRCATPAPTAGLDGARGVRRRCARASPSPTSAPPEGVRPPDDCPSFRDPPPEEFAEFDDGPSMTSGSTSRAGRRIGHPPWEDYEPDVVAARAVVPLRRPAPRRRRHVGPARARRAVRHDAGRRRRTPRCGRRETPLAAAERRLHRARPRPARSEWVLTVNRARHAGEGYASADMEIWDVDSGAEPRLGRVRHPGDVLHVPRGLMVPRRPAS